MTGLWHGPLARAPRSRRLTVSLVLLLLATLAPGAVAPVAAAECTGWNSTLQPPKTIRVLRTRGPAAGRVQTVDFRAYVEIVMPAEWGPTHPREVLRAGAVAIKQYAWYHTMNWRGRSAAGGCYDVVDSTNDQVYSPETKRPSPVHVSAVDATWSWSMRRGGKFFASGYRAGASVACGADAGVGVMYQNSASRCARDGKSATEILRIYYGGNIDILDGDGEPVVDGEAVAAAPPPPALPSGLAGFGDSTGDRKGDVIVVARPADPSVVETRVYPSAQTAGNGGVAAAVLPHPQPDTLFRSAGDVSGDGLEDLAVLLRGEDGSLRIEVAQAVKDAGLAPPIVWWQGVPGDLGWSESLAIRFATADVDGDSHADALILIDALDPNALIVTATMWLLPSTGSAFGSPVPWWIGPIDVAAIIPIAADVDGDGRTDVVFQEDRSKAPDAGRGLRFSVVAAAAVASDGAATPPVPWFEMPEISQAQARIAVTDLNRDRRHDLVIARPLGTSGTQLVGLISNGAGFSRRTLWQNATSFRWSVSRVTGADIDGDGHGDVVIMYNLGTRGTRFFRFLSDGSSLRVDGSTTDPTLPWAGTAMY